MSNTEKIREYLAKFEELAKVEPPMYADEAHDTEPTEEWEAWNSRSVALLEEYREAIVKAITARVAHELEGEGAAASVNDLLRRILDEDEVLAITTRPVTALDFPLDKVNSKVWKLFEEPQPNGQMRMAIGVGSESDRRNGKQIDIAYSIDFRELEELENVKITRKLEPYDERVYIAVGALFKAGYDNMSYQQIYNAMRYDGRAGASDLRKIHAAVSKMSGAHIYVDNIEESSVYSYGHFLYDGSLLPMERVTAIVNGQLAESVIHVFREPPLLTLARERNQITTIKRELLASPLNMTNANIQLENYLIESISHMRDGKRQCKMLFETIYRNAKIPKGKQRQRSLEKIEKLLKHYVKCGWITGYKMEKDGVRIAL